MAGYRINSILSLNSIEKYYKDFYKNDISEYDISMNLKYEFIGTTLSLIQFFVTITQSNNKRANLLKDIKTNTDSMTLNELLLPFIFNVIISNSNKNNKLDIRKELLQKSENICYNLSKKTKIDKMVGDGYLLISRANAKSCV